MRDPSDVVIQLRLDSLRTLGADGGITTTICICPLVLCTPVAIRSSGLSAAGVARWDVSGLSRAVPPGELSSLRSYCPLWLVSNLFHGAASPYLISCRLTGTILRPLSICVPPGVARGRSSVFAWRSP